MRSATKSSTVAAKPGTTVARQRSKTAARALRRRDQRMAQNGERRPIVQQRYRSARRAEKRGIHSFSPHDREKLWWMIAVPSRELLRRVPFVIGVMGILAVGLAATLWLTTRSTEESSTLSGMRSHNRDLEHEKERLQRSLEQGESVAELARRAAQLGMIPAGDVAKLVPQPDGSVKVVGKPKPAEGVPELPLDSGVTAPAVHQPPQTPDEVPAQPQPPQAQQPPSSSDDSVEQVRPTQIPPTPDRPATPESPAPPASQVSAPGFPFLGQAPSLPQPLPGLPQQAPPPGLPPPAPMVAVGNQSTSDPDPAGPVVPPPPAPNPQLESSQTDQAAPPPAPQIDQEPHE